MNDGFGRMIDYLRVSVTDRCNLRCVYCMPPQGVAAVPHGEILRYEEITRLCRVFAGLGVRTVRLIGGEPLVRRDIDALVRALKDEVGMERVTLTTNGVLLEAQLPALLAAGLDGVNISLDALGEDCFLAITRRPGAETVRRAVFAALAAPGLTVKLNCVPMGQNDGELVAIAALAKEHPIAVRFIECMPIGEGRGSTGRTEAEVRALLEDAFGPLTPTEGPIGAGPCRYFTAAGFVGKIGLISAVSHPFCGACNRVRLTADGFFKPCLQYSAGADLRGLLRGGADDGALKAAIQAAIDDKPRGHRFCGGVVQGEEGRGMSQIGG